MNIKWSNGVHRNRTCNITSINDIQKYDEDGFFCLRIKEGTGLLGGILGKFKSMEAREKAYNDIENALGLVLKMGVHSAISTKWQ